MARRVSFCPSLTLFPSLNLMSLGGRPSILASILESRCCFVCDLVAQIRGVSVCHAWSSVTLATVASRRRKMPTSNMPTDSPNSQTLRSRRSLFSSKYSTRESVTIRRISRGSVVRYLSRRIRGSGADTQPVGNSPQMSVTAQLTSRMANPAKVNHLLSVFVTILSGKNASPATVNVEAKARTCPNRRSQAWNESH